MSVKNVIMKSSQLFSLKQDVEKLSSENEALHAEVEKLKGALNKCHIMLSEADTISNYATYIKTNNDCCELIKDVLGKKEEVQPIVTPMFAEKIRNKKKDI